MMELEDLMAACRAADTDKITERKKQMQKIRTLLNKSRVQKALDQNTDRMAHDKKQRLVSWDYLIKVGKKLVHLEAGMLEKKKGKSATSKDVKGLESVTLLKFLAKQANKRGCRLKALSLVSHIQDVLIHPYMCDLFCSEYATLLLKEVLQVAKCRSQLTAEVTQDLLETFCGLLNDTPVSCDRSQLARCVCLLLKVASGQADMRPHKLTSFFHSFYANIKEEKNNRVLEYISMGMRILCEMCGCTWRLMMCQLGEEVHSAMLYLWKHHPTDCLKRELVRLLCHQMELHCHQGELMLAAHQKERWKECVQQLYEVLEREISDLASRSVITAGKTEELPQDMVKLSALVFTEVYQRCESGERQSEEPTPKKRRCEVGWSAIMDSICQASWGKVLWLQVLSKMLKTTPAAVSVEVYQKLLTTLSQLQKDTHKPAILKHCLMCLTNLAACQRHLKLPVVSSRDCVALWKKVWLSSVRHITLHHVKETNWQLLQTIAQHGLSSPGNEIANLFKPYTSHGTQDSVSFLCELLHSCDINENSQSSDVTLVESVQSGHYPFRSQVLEWLFPELDDLCDTSELLIAEKVQPKLLASLLVALTLRDHEVPMWPSGGHKTNQKSFTADLESFIQTLTRVKSREGPPQQCVSSLLVKVDEVIIRDTQRLQGIEEATTEYGKKLLCQCSLIVQLFSLRLAKKMVTLEELLTSPLYNLLKNMMQQVSNIAKKGGATVLSALMKHLLLFLTFDLERQDSAVMTSLCQSVISKGLLRVILDAAQNVWSGGCSNNNNNSRRQSSSRASAPRRSQEQDLDDFGDVDDFSLTASSSVLDDEDEEEEDDFSPSQLHDSDGLLQERDNMDGHDDILSTTALTESQRVGLECVEFLCLLCRDTGMEELSSTRVDLITNTRTEILNLLEAEVERKLDADKIMMLQMVKIIIETWTQPGLPVEDGSLETLFDVLRCCCRQFQQVPQACEVLLHLLVKLVPHVSAQEEDSMLSECQRDCQDILLRLIQAFIKLSPDYPVSTRKALLDAVFAAVKAGISLEKDDSPTDTQVSPLRAQFVNMLLDKSRNMEILQLVCQRLHVLFVDLNGEELVPLCRKEQQQAFDYLLHTLKELMPYKKKDGTMKSGDSTENRVRAVLAALEAVAVSSRICEGQAIFTLLTMAHDLSLDPPVVNQVLGNIATKLKYTSIKHCMMGHLSYLLGQWLQLPENAFTEFPFTLMGYSSQEEFYRCCKRTIVAQLVCQQHHEAAGPMAQVLGQQEEDLLLECIPSSIVTVLPYFACGDQLGDPDGKSRADNTYDLLEKKLTSERINQSIAANLDETVVYVLKMLFENDSMNPEPSPPHFSPAVIQKTLVYLTSCHDAKAKTLVSLLTKSQDGVQRVLLSLCENMASSHWTYEYKRGFQMYAWFARQVLQEFHQGLNQSWAFVLRAVLFVLTHTINKCADPTRASRICLERDEGSTITSLSLQLMLEVSQCAVENCPQELGRFLPPVLKAVQKAQSGYPNLAEQAKQLLDLLLVEHAGRLTDSIQSMPLFPEHNKNYRRIQEKLKSSSNQQGLAAELDAYLRIFSMWGWQGVDLNDLKQLRTLLKQHKKELTSIITQQSDREGRALLSRLVLKLMELTDGGEEAMKQAMAQCLGVLGPVPLMSIPSNQREVHPDLRAALLAFHRQPQNQQYCHVFHLLDQCLLSPDIELVSVTSQVLKRLLSTKTAQQFVSEYKQNKLGPLFQHLQPFRDVRKKAPALQSAPSLDTTRFIKQIVGSEAIQPQHSVSYSKWICQLCCALIDSTYVQDEILWPLRPVCAMEANFSGAVLPFLVHDVLSSGHEEVQDALSKEVSEFFDKHCQALAASNSSSQESTEGDTAGDRVWHNQECVQALLDVVQYLRQQDRPAARGKTSLAWNNNFWLQLDYLQLSQAAQRCGRYYSAVLLAEIWCMQQWEQIHGRDDGRGDGPDYDEFGTTTPIEHLCGVLGETEQRRDPMALMLDISCHIREPDAVYGYGAGKITNKKTRIQTYKHEKNWTQALLVYDQMMTEGAAAAEHGLLQALDKFGGHHMLDQYLKRTGETSKEVQDLQYDMAWRNTQWNLHVSSRSEDAVSYSKAVYTCLQSLQNQEPESCLYMVNQARLAVVKKMGSKSLECPQSIQQGLVKLLGLTEIEDAVQILDTKNLSEYVQLLDQMSHFEFELMEPVLSQRCVLVQLLTARGSHRELYTCLQQLMQRAVDAGRLQVAEGVLQHLQQVARDGEMLLQYDCQVKEAELFWHRQESNSAKHLMRKAIGQMSLVGQTDVKSLYARCLVTFSNWLDETKSEHPSRISEQYLSKAEAIYNQGQTSDEAVQAYFSLARFADAQYQNIVKYMKSSAFEQKRQLIKQAKQEMGKIKEIQQQGSATKYFKTLEKQCMIDEKELKVMVDDKYSFLEQAVHYYLRCIQHGHQHNLRVFRIVALWFDNASHLKINQIIKDGVVKAESHKFLPLMYQLAARMTTKNHHCGLFVTTLNELIERCALDHPYHSLFILLALAHQNKDKEMMMQKRRGKLSSQDAQPSDEEERVTAAKQMVARLKKSHRGDIVANAEKLALSYIELAYLNVEQHKRNTKPIPLPSSLMLTKISKLKDVAILTKDMKVDPTCEYKDIVHVVKYQPNFQLIGGINLPKKVMCLGSDGINRTQLVKGKDDMRQDAVMQQVFQLVNQLLHHNRDTKLRNLLIRTYKVIPMSQCSGILEWCEGTQPFASYLIGPNGAHERYHPKDYNYVKCRSIMNSVQGANFSAEDKLRAFRECCKFFRPVMRHFFLEKFPDPTDWYEKRQAYIRSLATNSIVGYILGLGDRHVQNILIDNNSGEVIHIDLGVAFEQGKVLPTPETVPFRLTRDVVDGMGITGVEGVFRRCCEKTMEVMRGSQEALLTILQVLLYDPLYSWSLSPLKAYQRQQRKDRTFTEASELNTTADNILFDADIAPGAPAEDVNRHAERVLMRLQQKLQGMEEGVQLSVSGQVNLLIQQARSASNLSRLFPGWQPYI